MVRRICKLHMQNFQFFWRRILTALIICLLDICTRHCNLYFFCTGVFIYCSHMSSSYFLCNLSLLIFPTISFLLQVYKYFVFVNFPILYFLQSWKFFRHPNIHMKTVSAVSYNYQTLSLLCSL